MELPRFPLRLLAPLLALALALGVAAPGASDDADAREARDTTATDDGTWLEGADGFVEALDQATADATPLAIYFYTDWCGYCRQLERELLFRTEVEDYLGGLTKVRINPEHGQQESAIAQRYGVFGFPAFFLHPGPGHEAQRVTGRVKRDNKWQMQTPEEFIATLNGVVERAQ